MSLLSNESVVEPVGWMLVHSCWLLLIPAVLLAILLSVLPSKWARVRYAAGLVALLAMMVLPLAPFGWAYSVRPAATSVGVVETSANETLSMATERASLPSEVDVGISTGNSTSEVLGASEDRLSDSSGIRTEASIVETEPTASSAEQAEVMRLPTATGKTDANAEASLADRIRPWLPWFVTAWFAGTILMAARLILGWLSMRRLATDGQSSVPEAVNRIFRELQLSIGASKAAKVAQSTMVKVPSVVGHFRPIVLLPVAAMTGLTEQQLRAILAHELAHVRRYDYAVNILQTVIETVLFYHPAVWWVSRVVRTEREHCCDDIALAANCDAAELAKALIAVDAVRSVPERVFLAGADGGNLLRRVRRLAGVGRENRFTRNSWVAGLLAMSLLVFVGLLAALHPTNAADNTAADTNKADDEETQQVVVTEQATGQRGVSRLQLEGGFFLELAAVGEFGAGDGNGRIWDAAGDIVERPFDAGRTSELELNPREVARQIYIRSLLPAGATLSLLMDGKKLSGYSEDTRGDGPVTIQSTAVAILPASRETFDITVELNLPAWRTLATFDFAGGVKNGIRMEREREVTPFTRLTATGAFGADTKADDVRIIAFDREHRPLEVSAQGSESEDGGITKLTANYQNSQGRPRHIVVQRRIKTHPIVFRDVPLLPGKHEGIRVQIEGFDEEVASSDSSASSVRSIQGLLAQPMEPLAAELPGVGTMRLVSVNEASSDSPGWLADGSPRLVPFRDDKLGFSNSSNRNGHRELEVFFEFEASSPDVRLGRVNVRPDDGSGTLVWKPVKFEEDQLLGVRLLQGLNILDDRETEDFEVEVFAGPTNTLTTVSVDDAPEDFAETSWLGYTPKASAKSFAFPINQPKETDAGWRHVLLLILPNDAPEGAVLTAITADGQRVEGFTSSRKGRKILGVFNLPSKQNIQSIEISTRPKHSMVFRNVSLWSGLGSSAFVDHQGDAPIALNSMTPSRIFLLPNGDRIAEQVGVGSGFSPAVAAANEISQRGGLFRFDAKDKAPNGKTLPYLTEIRWRDFRADELRWVRALAGLTRLQLSSEHITDDSLKSIEHLTTLTEIQLSRSRHLSTACLKSIGQLTQLRELSLYGRSLKWNDEDYDSEDFNYLNGLKKIVEWEPQDWRMDDAGISWLREAEDLKMVYGWGPEVTDKGFAALANKPDLGVIYLGATKITDASFKLLENHPELYWLQCSSPNLTDAAIDSAITMPRLRDLHLHGSKVTDAGVERLIAAIDRLPRLRTVILNGTGISKTVADRLQASKPGLRVLGGVSEQSQDADAEVSELEATTKGKDTSWAADKNAKPKTSDPDSPAAGGSLSKAPTNVPWPTEKFKSFANYPPIGSGIKVKLDDRRFVELNSLSSFPQKESDELKVFWKPDGTLINPPDDFDPLSLVPMENGGFMPKVTREAAIQIVAPSSTQWSLRSGGGGGYGRIAVPVDDEFTQFPIQYPIGELPTNHTYIEVRVTKASWQSLPVDGNDDIQVLMVPDEHRMVLIADSASDFAWEADVQFEGDEEPRAIGPFVTGVSLDSGLMSKSIRQQLTDSPSNHRAVMFAFNKQQPFPRILSLRRSKYDVVRFENLSVFPGPKSAVKVSVNGVLVSDIDQPTLLDAAEVPPITAPPVKKKEKGMINFTSTVVNSEGQPVPNCWVGMFVAPQSFNERKADESAFEPQFRLVIETTTDDQGRFTIQAPKDHFVFDGSFWAIADDGRSGVQRLNCVWSYLKKNVKLVLDEDIAEVKIVDPTGQPLAGVEVVPEAIGHRRRPAHHFPIPVQQKLKSVTDDKGTIKIPGWSAGGIRGIAVTAKGFGTQYLNPRMPTQWVEDGETLILTLHRVASLTGRVIGFDPQLDRDLKLQIRTEAYEQRTRPPMFGRAMISIANDGSFRVPAIAEGYVAFDASTPPDSERKVRFASVARLEIGEDRQLPIGDCPEIVNAVTVRQRLIKSDTREGAANVKLRVLWGDALDHRGSWNSSKPTVTDADGWWEAKVLPGTINARINGIPRGYQGTAWFDGRNGSLGVEHTIPATGKVVILPPEVYVPALEIKGRLLLPDGKPAVNWSAYGHPVSWNDVGVGGVDTDKNGEFTWTYPTGYPPRLFNVSNRTWLTEHNFKDDYAYPKVISEVPFVLQVPEPED